jgi:hypothetical protein
MKSLIFENESDLLFTSENEEPFQGSLATLSRAEQGSDRVDLKRSIDLTNGLRSGNHETILYLEFPHINC